MNKEKQIEDMAKDIENADKVATQQILKETIAFVEEHHRYHSILDFPLAHNKTVHELTAELLYDLGYLKIPSDAVVLTREQVEQARKETAREILEELWNNKFEAIIKIQNKCSKEDVENIGKAILLSIRNKLKEIAQRYEVEVEV